MRSALFSALAQQRRATELHTHARIFWVAVEQLPMLRAVYPAAAAAPELPVPAPYATRQWDTSEALRELLRGRLQAVGPTTSGALAQLLSIAEAAIDGALLALES